MDNAVLALCGFVVREGWEQREDEGDYPRGLAQKALAEADALRAEIAALKADLEAARATIASLAEKIAQAVEDDTKRMREQIEERRMFREIGGYLRMRFNRLLSRLHDRKDVSLTECFDLLDADLARHKRALAAGPAALRDITDDYDGAAEIVEAAQAAAMKEGT